VDVTLGIVIQDCGPDLTPAGVVDTDDRSSGTSFANVPLDRATALSRSRVKRSANSGT
jgi:hypothetical protein